MKWAKLIYVGILVAVYVWLETYYRLTKSNEAGISLIILMTILTLPLGVIVPLILSLMHIISVHFLLSIPGELESFAFWLIMAAIGYWQWFILLPKLIARIKKRRGAKGY